MAYKFMSADIKRITGTIPEFRPTATATQLARRIEEEGGAIAEGVAMLIREQDKQMQQMNWQNGKFKEVVDNQEVIAENQTLLHTNQEALKTTVTTITKDKENNDASFNAYKNIGVWVIGLGAGGFPWLLSKMFGP
jgi:hypothetical protein